MLKILLLEFIETQLATFHVQKQQYHTYHKIRHTHALTVNTREQLAHGE